MAEPDGNISQLLREVQELCAHKGGWSSRNGLRIHLVGPPPARPDEAIVVHADDGGRVDISAGWFTKLAVDLADCDVADVIQIVRSLMDGNAVEELSVRDDATVAPSSWRIDLPDGGCFDAHYRTSRESVVTHRFTPWR